jgi:hypothetical protein
LMCKGSAVPSVRPHGSFLLHCRSSGCRAPAGLPARLVGGPPGGGDGSRDPVESLHHSRVATVLLPGRS